MPNNKSIKKTSALEGAGTRYRRTDLELIADLEERIKDLKERQQSRSLKRSPAIKASVAAVKYLDKALSSAQDEENNHLRHVLADARRPLEVFLSGMGLKLPKVSMPRGRRPAALAGSAEEA